ncbi:MAG: hypothetical protein DRP27_00670 [Thermotogae bacterium]|nr:MAG: hypothetical protein DRP27_00670 [Thermotogota bacterium]
MDFKLSFSTAALFPRNSVESLKLVEEAGFHYAELMPQCLEETKPRFAKEIKTHVKLKIASVHFPLVFQPVFYNPYPGMMKEAKNLIDDVTALAGDLAAEIIVIHPPYFADEVVESLFYTPVMDNMRYLCEKASRNGVKVALENSPKGGRTVEEMLQMIHAVGHENIFPMLDTTEAVESGQDPVDMLKRLDVIHIHASGHKGKVKHIPPGEDEFDWMKIILVLCEKHFSGFFTVEPSYRYFLEKPVEKMKNVLKFLSGL